MGNHPLNVSKPFTWKVNWIKTGSHLGMSCGGALLESCKTETKREPPIFGFTIFETIPFGFTLGMVSSLSFWPLCILGAAKNKALFRTYQGSES